MHRTREVINWVWGDLDRLVIYLYNNNFFLLIKLTMKCNAVIYNKRIYYNNRI